MMKVDLIFSSNINAPNGASVLVRKIGEAHKLFRENGIEQRIISPEESSFEREEKTAKVPLLKIIVRWLSKYSVIITYLRFQRSCIKPAKKILNIYDKLDDKGEIVVFHEILTCYCYIKKQRTLNSVSQKIILTLHGNGELWNMLYIEMPRFKSVFLYNYKKNIEKTIINYCYKIGFDADSPRENFCKTYHISNSRTFFIYNGIESRLMPSREKATKLKLISLATLSERKNQAGIINAISMLPIDYQQKIEVVFVGDGAIRCVLEERASHLSSKVLFAGAMKEKEYYKLLEESNCFCLYSKDEGMPIAVIEGMRAGLPIIGSRVAGIPEEIIDGKTGFLVNLDDCELCKKLKWMVDHLEALSDMGKASYNYFQDKFTTEAMVKKYSEIYNS